MERLLALRTGVGKAGRAIGKGAKNVLNDIRERDEAMLQAERDRNRDLIERNFGSVENYENFLREQPPLPKTPGQSLGDFFKRVLRTRE